MSDTATVDRADGTIAFAHGSARDADCCDRIKRGCLLRYGHRASGLGGHVRWRSAGIAALAYSQTIPANLQSGEFITAGVCSATATTTITMARGTHGRA
jgi:hypothetical protein